MKNRRVRHLPVVGDDDERLLGVVSIGDLNAYETDDHQKTIFLMSEYIYGRVYRFGAGGAAGRVRRYNKERIPARSLSGESRS